MHTISNIQKTTSTKANSELSFSAECMKKMKNIDDGSQLTRGVELCRLDQIEKCILKLRQLYQQSLNKFGKKNHELKI